MRFFDSPALLEQAEDSCDPILTVTGSQYYGVQGLASSKSNWSLDIWLPGVDAFRTFLAQVGAGMSFGGLADAEEVL